MKRTQQESDQSFIAEALPAFISEAREQLENIEQLLLQLEGSPDDRDLLDALFRCAHTVKGSAGIFGLTQLVEFAHHVETLLDRMREGHVTLDPSLSTLLLQCNDQILHLVDVAGDPSRDDEDHVSERADLVCRLQAAVGGGQSASAGAARATGETAAAAPAGGRWHVSAEFGTECMRNGMDPLGIVRYLGTLGDVVAIACDRSNIPSLAALDPESCHLTVEIGLVTEATQTEIEAAFSFVKDDCRLRLIAPSAPLENYLNLLDDMPDHPQLGQLLANIGAITQAQLDAALQHQSALRADGGEAPRLGDVLQVSACVAPEIVAAAVGKQQRQREAAADDNRYIRVQADRLDAVINLLGELVIAGAGASLMARQTRHSGLTEASQHMSRLIEEIRNGTLQLRMVPIGETFGRFRRVVRDTASQLGKEVALEIEGADTELDKSVVEKIADPLMHLVRNGLDHGLETPEQREAAGKPRQGRLVLSARHESGSILIRIRDDGRGIDRTRVLKRAWERGLVDVDVTPPDAEILKLIFAPGFSTAEQVTNLSGRGVGMDVVRKNIEALRGTVEVSSQFGHGTVIDIRLPLTLAIIDGFLVGVGVSRFVLPLESVVEVIEGRDPQDEQAMPDEQGCFCLPLRGELLPVLSLRRLYSLEGDAPERVSVVVVRAGDRRYGIEVDMLLGQHQTVIKPLGRMFRTLRGISGSSILGNGEVALIFDVPSLSLLAAEPPGFDTRAARETALPGHSVNTSSEGQPS
jgi:two-component system chemotaxis sensor kinase CheA